MSDAFTWEEKKRSVSGGKIVLRKFFVVFRSEAGKELAESRTVGPRRCADQVYALWEAQPFLSRAPSAPTPGHGAAVGS